MARVFAAAIALLIVSGCAIAAPPKVVETNPRHNAIDVDPALQKVRVTFDQPMDPLGLSVVGGGPHFPTISGKPAWLNETTLELPVKLEPGKAYELGFNSERHRNFKNKAGESAVPYPLRFRTADAIKTEPLTAAEIDESIRQLRTVIQDHYSYRDLRWVDWDRRFRSFEPQLRQATTPLAFAAAAAELLSAAQDPHLMLKVGDEAIATFRRAVRPNINAALLPKILPQFVRHTPTVSSARLPGEIGYLLITGWDSSDKAAASAIDDVLNSPSSAKGIIIDVRLNTGGDERRAGELACRFIDAPAIYARHVIRDPRPTLREETGFTPPVDRIIEPAEESRRYKGRVVVLTGPVVMSSCEAFVLMMKQSPRCTVVGEPTYGSSGNPLPYTLDCGIVAWIPSWKAMKLDGSLLEGQGVHPDVLIKTSNADFAERDPLIDRAAEILQKD